MFQHVCFNNPCTKHAKKQQNEQLFGGVLRKWHPWFFFSPLIKMVHIRCFIAGQVGTQKNRARVKVQKWRYTMFSVLCPEIGRFPRSRKPRKHRDMVILSSFSLPVEVCLWPSSFILAFISRCVCHLPISSYLTFKGVFVCDINVHFSRSRPDLL